MKTIYSFNSKRTGPTVSGAVPVLSWEEGGDGQVVLRAGLSRVPVGLASRAELEGTDGALDQLGQRRRICLL